MSRKSHVCDVFVVSSRLCATKLHSYHDVSMCDRDQAMSIAFVNSDSNHYCFVNPSLAEQDTPPWFANAEV